MFSSSVSSNNSDSCETTENSPRRSASVISATPVPSSVTRPACTSTSRVSTLKTVDLPAPEAPTSAVVCPASATKLAPRSTGVSP